MRKNVKNDKVIRAMAIGISAMLMASSPLTALAAEGEGTIPEGNDDNNITVTPEAGIADQAQEAADKAAAEAKEAEDKAHEVKGEVQEGTKDAETEVGKELAEDIWEANANIEAATSEDGASIKNAGTDIANADTALDVAEANDELSDAELKNAAEAAAEAEKAAEEVKDAMQEAQEKVDGQVEDIKDASTIEDANAAYEEVKKTAEQAEIDFQEKLVNYNDAKAAYEEAAEKLAASEKAYQDAINSADANAAAAAAELANAQENAKALADALSAAKKAVDDSAAGAMDIVEKEELTQNDNGLNWGNEDKLFQSIMKNYYLPEVIGKDTTISEITVSNPIKSADSSYNYFKVTYKDAEGNTQVKYYNYLMDDNQTSKDNIVIFEKRFEEVDWKNAQETNPDQYVDEKGNVVDKDQGLSDGTVVEVDGKFVEKNDVTKSETLVSDSEITGTSKEDVTVNENTRNESWSMDEQGNLIKTVTADVTTITYTEATFESDKNYETAEERDAAAAAAKKELAPATSGKDATITNTENTDYTYTASGTYIPTFTKTVDVKNEEVEWKHTDKKTDLGVRTEAEAVAKVTKEQETALRDKINDDDDLYLIGVSSDLKVTGYTEDHWYDDSDFLVSGTVSATYAKVTKKTVDQSTLGAIWDDIKSLFGKGETANKKLEEAAKKAVEADGGIFVSANWDDWKLGKATIRYVAGVKASTEEKASAKDAENALQDAMLAQAKESGASGIYNVKSNTEEIAHTSYSYTIDYLERTSKSTENQTIERETYEEAEVLTGQIIQNLNYIQGNIKLTQKDKDYRKFVDDAKDLTAKYKDLLEDAQDAQTEVEEAQAAVDALQKEIENLKKDRTGNLDALSELETKLTAAEKNKQAAEDTLKDITKKLDEAGEELEKVIERLTPTPEPEEPTPAPEEPTPAPEAPTPTPEAPTPTPEAPTPTPEAPAATPEAPAATPEAPAATPEAPAATPEAPAATPEAPAATPEAPAATPEAPAATPEAPAATPEAPAATPEAPAATPEAPAATPEASAPTPAGTLTEAGTDNGDDDDDSDETAVAAPVVLAEAPVAQAAVVTQNQAVTPVVQITDETTPLAGTVQADGQETAQTGLDKGEAQEAVNIEEEAVPLADVAVEDEHAKMSWWWLLIVMILGATGYEMYKKHNEKKLKAQVENEENAE